jgi:hypothetical protein
MSLHGEIKNLAGHFPISCLAGVFNSSGRLCCDAQSQHSVSPGALCDRDYVRVPDDSNGSDQSVFIHTDLTFR